MNVQDTPPIIISRYGNHVIQWEPGTLQRVLEQLQSDRHHSRDIGTLTLIAEAEQIKNNTNDILEVDASQ